MKKRVVSLLLALLLVLALSPALADAGQKAGLLTYQDIQVLVDGQPMTEYDDTGAVAEPFIMNGVVYVPVGTIPGARWAADESTVYFGEAPAADAHGWVLVNTAHELMEDSSDNNRTWRYRFDQLAGKGLYTIDYTWQYGDEYAHYTALGECSDPPAVIPPEARFTVDLHVWAENVAGNGGVWGILYMGNIKYNRNSDHYAAYTGRFTAAKDGDPLDYNCRDGEFRWQVGAEFPVGEPGETIEIQCLFHRGDQHPIITTWTYAWSE